jgi:predicted DNA-binding transcriptional regulator YafY
LQVVYRTRDRSKVAEPRVLHPHLLHCYRDQWRLVAWEPAKERMATYLLSGIQQAELLGKTFERQSGFTADGYFDGAFGVFAGNEDHQVEIQFSPEGAERVRGRLWHKTQEIIDLDDGGMSKRPNFSPIDSGLWA